MKNRISHGRIDISSSKAFCADMLFATASWDKSGALNQGLYMTNYICKNSVDIQLGHLPLKLINSKFIYIDDVIKNKYTVNMYKLT